MKRVSGGQISIVPPEALKEASSSLETIMAQDKLLTRILKPDQEPFTVPLQSNV